MQSVPGELSLDHSIVLQKAEKTSHVSVATMVSDYGWTEVRAKKVLVSCSSAIQCITNWTVILSMYSMWYIGIKKIQLEVPN